MCAGPTRGIIDCSIILYLYFLSRVLDAEFVTDTCYPEGSLLPYEKPVSIVLLLLLMLGLSAGARARDEIGARASWD